MAGAGSRDFARGLRARKRPLTGKGQRRAQSPYQACRSSALSMTLVFSYPQSNDSHAFQLHMICAPGDFTAAPGRAGGRLDRGSGISRGLLERRCVETLPSRLLCRGWSPAGPRASLSKSELRDGAPDAASPGGPPSLHRPLLSFFHGAW